MLSLAGEVLAKLGWIGSGLTKINVFVQFFFVHSRENATSYYNLLDILKFDNIFKLKVGLFAHNIINDPTGITTIFSGTLPLASDCHSHYTRFVSNLNFHSPQINNNYGASTFSFIASKIWETIPLEFKNYVTAASLNTSSYICLIRNLFPRIYWFSLLWFNHF